MTLGKKLKKLRTEKGLTQKNLAEQLHVTFQTVSKWESDINEPDITTLKQLSKFYGCSINDLLNDASSETKENNVGETVDNKPTEVITKTIVVHQNEKHVCARCGKDIEENELVSEDITKKERHGRIIRSVNVGQTYYHRDCLDEIKKEREINENTIRTKKASTSKKKCFGWGIAAGVVALIIALAVFLTHTNIVHPTLGVLYSVLIGYGLFAMIYCIISDSYIGDIFLWCSGFSIKFPGLIFSFDLDGLAWLIAMKILFAAIGFIIGVVVLLAGTALCALLGGFSFPFVLAHNIRTNYKDAF